MLLVIAHHCSPNTDSTSCHCPIQNYKNGSDLWNAKAWASLTRLRLTRQDRIRTEGGYGMANHPQWNPPTCFGTIHGSNFCAAWRIERQIALRRARSVSKTTEAKVVHPCWPSCGQSARIDPLQNGHPRIQLQKRFHQRIKRILMLIQFSI